ncbi:MAG: DEAD/DEAH box helicase, partial [Planctomycetes bacterium]|nr:DEAD/DEAH box helicase [Planctomycetota bacterium]
MHSCGAFDHGGLPREVHLPEVQCRGTEAGPQGSSLAPLPQSFTRSPRSPGHAHRESSYVSFAKLGLKEPILRGVADAGYEQPTDIQANAIPKILRGAELIGLGQTGSGKTAAFGLPMLNRLCGGEPGLRGLIIVPTRELCVQVAENLRTYAKYTGLHVCTAFGGVDMSIQESAFKRGVDVVVACPGRLIDHL